MGIDRERVIPDPQKSLKEKPIAPWNTPAYAKRYAGLFAACREHGIPLDVPYAELKQAEREFVWSGGNFTNLDRFFKWVERRSYRVHMRVLLARYRAYTRCPACLGTRLVPEAGFYRLHGETIDALAGLSLRDLTAWFDATSFSERERDVASSLLAQLDERLSVLNRVGLGYLTLNRQARTLSGGETQRIHLGAALGSGLTSTLYVLDEPTVGLHAQDSEALLGIVRDLAGRGNTVLVVEHDPILIRGADWLIDLGPAAGEWGGELMAEGAPGKVLEHPHSLTARFLNEELAGEVRDSHAGHAVIRPARLDPEAAPRVAVLGAREHNLRNIDVEIPLGLMTAVTGVSGSGKSTLIENVLYANYQRSQGVVDVEPGLCDELVGFDQLEDVLLVDQRPLGRSSRSNPVTYMKAWDEFRKLFAKDEIAKRRGITAGHFSFNTDKGRCPECLGTGLQVVDMHFMADIEIVCEACQGQRFRPEVLAVPLGGRNVAQVLELTVDEAAAEYAPGQRALGRKLQALRDTGLGYLRLGQSTATLSGGEAQRLKLASYLAQASVRKTKHAPRLFLFDEPTTGLHLSDIDLLASTLRRLCELGDGVVVIEHSLELVEHCDWLIELGPGGGDEGGERLYQGPAAGLLELAGSSPTAQAILRSRAGCER